MVSAYLRRFAGRVLSAAVALGALSLAPHAFAASGSDGGSGGGGTTSGDATLPGEVLVKLRSTTALAPLLARYHLTVLGQFGSRPIYRLKSASTIDTRALVATLLTELDVLIAEQNVVERSPEARRRSNAAWAIGEASNYVAQWAPQAMNLSAAHGLALGGRVRVAVLDTGVDTHHPALAGKLLPGFDFVDFDRNPSEVGTVANVAYGHGTHVAGLVALVAPDALIMPIRVLDADGFGNTWVLSEALLYAADPDGNSGTDDGAQVINLSLGTTSRTGIFRTVSNLASCAITAVVDVGDDVTDPGYNEDKVRCTNFSGVGAVVVAAAGNDGTDRVRQYPAAEGTYGLISVGASNSLSRLASFSNFGSWVDLAAPGDGITSSVPGGLYGTWSGTSMAAPLVSGTAALVRSLNPTMSAVDVARRVIRAGTAMCDKRMPQLNASSALRNVVALNPLCP